MMRKIALLIAALTLTLPAFADNPAKKATNTTTKASASNSASKPKGVSINRNKTGASSLPLDGSSSHETLKTAPPASKGVKNAPAAKDLMVKPPK